MISFLVSLIGISLFVSGTYAPNWTALALAFLLLVWLLIVVQQIQYGPIAGFKDCPEAVKTQQLIDALAEFEADAPVYVAVEEIAPVHDVFTARLDGRQAVVIARGVAPAEEQARWT